MYIIHQCLCNICLKLFLSIGHWYDARWIFQRWLHYYLIMHAGESMCWSDSPGVHNTIYKNPTLKFWEIPKIIKKIFWIMKKILKINRNPIRIYVLWIMIHVKKTGRKESYNCRSGAERLCMFFMFIKYVYTKCKWPMRLTYYILIQLYEVCPALHRSQHVPNNRGIRSETNDTSW